MLNSDVKKALAGLAVLALIMAPWLPNWLKLAIAVVGYLGVERFGAWRQTRRDAEIQASALSLRESLYFEADGMGEPEAQGAAPQSLRSQIADLDPRRALSAWSRLRRLGELPDPETAGQVLGVVLESGREIASRFLAAYADGYVKIVYTDGETVVVDP